MWSPIILFACLLASVSSLCIHMQSLVPAFETAFSQLVEDLYDFYGDENGNLVFPKYYENVEYNVTEYNDPTYTFVDIEERGRAVGTVLKTYTGKPFKAFMGIKYATAEVFEMPEPYEELFDTDIIVDEEISGYDATFLKDRCAQYSIITPVVSGSDDCLHVSVYTPMDIENYTYPVMVWIHGGAYISGDASLYIPSKLMEKDVVTVVVQYRLGSLGFLYSGSDNAPGNMGLKDQVLALRWVHDHIHNFGGQTDSVTVFGQSAGGASASWMQLTPQTSAEWNSGQEILHRVIPQSGSALEVWTLDHRSDEAIILHGQATGCYSEGDSADAIVRCMKRLSIDELTLGYLKVYSYDRARGGLGFLGMAPVVQTELMELYEGTEDEQKYIVIPREPLEMIANEEYRKVDVMTGSTRDEGSLVVAISYTDFLLPNNLTDDEMYLKYGLLPLLVDDFEISDKTDSVANSFRLGFLPNAEMGNWTQMSGGLVDLCGMLFLKSGLWKMSRLQTEKANPTSTYFYSFEFESDDSLFDWFFFGYPDIPIEGGVTHADELIYLFALPSYNDERETRTIEKLTSLWANFAKYGDPTPDSDVASWVEYSEKWLPYTLENQEFLLMKDEFSMDNDFVTRWNYNFLPPQTQ